MSTPAMSYFEPGIFPTAPHPALPTTREERVGGGLHIEQLSQLVQMSSCSTLVWTYGERVYHPAARAAGPGASGRAGGARERRRNDDGQLLMKFITQRPECAVFGITPLMRS